MKAILSIVAILLSFNVFSADIVRRSDTYIMEDTLSNTAGATYDGYVIIQLAPNIHKIVVIRPNGRYTTEFCDQIEKNSEIGQSCNEYDPDPIFAEWDAAQGAGNITAGLVLNNSEVNKHTANWFYQVYVANDLNGLYNELVADVGLTDSQRRERYFGTCRAYEFDNATCANFVTIRFDTGRRPRAGEMTLLKVPGRFKKMIDEMRRIIIE